MAAGWWEALRLPMRLLSPPATRELTALPGMSPDAAVATVAAALAWVVAGWLLLGALTTALAQLPGASGRVAHQVARTITPAAVRRTVEATLGCCVAIGSISQPAVADDGRPALPSLDRPVITSADPPAGYLVRAGDCLWSIAARHLPPTADVSAVGRAWPRWYAANRALIGSDPDVIRPGQRLRVPPVPTGSNELA